MNKIAIKICCISSVEEAQLAIESGASVLGLVGQMPSGPGVIDDDLIAEIAAAVPNHIETFLLTSGTKAADIIAHHKKVKTTAIQIVDALSEGSHQEIKRALPDIKIIQVLHVSGKGSINEAISVSKYVDAILLDSGNPNLQIKELGGTGRVHNWEISKTIVESVKIPVFLAGGLKPENAMEAVEKVGSYGLDLCSGVRTNGKLDIIKLRSFFSAINNK